MSAPTMHDYTRRGWGHDYVIHTVKDGGQQLHISGWGHGIAAGDFLLLKNGAGTTRYKVAEIKYHFNPSDMWAATVDFAPRPDVAVGAVARNLVVAS